MNKEMIFRCFSHSTESVNFLNREINNFIDGNEVDGFIVSDHTVHVTRPGENSLIKPIVTVTVWMELKAKT